MRTRVKICGITRLEDALQAVEAGADAIGFVFYPPSPRAVDIETAAGIVRSLPPFVETVGLFVNPDPELVRTVIEKVGVSLLQFHGDEPQTFCDQFAHRWIKAVRVRDMDDVPAAFREYPRAAGLLVDAYDPRKYGGTGQIFDWSLIPKERPRPLILAGGLNSANVASALAAVRPWAVDVSGGVELDKGIKDASRIIEFIKEVNRVG
ncbi:phosphoribosylanthranilate isomerase [Marinobacter nanhaiticus D15-8W]|uniref:N-(5'-phosphoribosyl)anthranilate isomerase n=1 Tax=Marinobacter nanhaiticus D15-8W TaxID=626887 RepID=N6VVN2_9GAMM|nr:phosphoribosylanthranilate isomerase [Marinobacter nanhaiticus]ENO14220.1 phosphoribosylanthranilate isomerase [Marinobacter nanhaiticus D15-8W]BES71607.1 phosphoribosylanthranilate isomerase [Marinobacter nanhaiticus D15-8W]